MWARRTFVILFLALFILSIFSIVSAAMNPFIPATPNSPPKSNELGKDEPKRDPWGQPGNTKIASNNSIKIGDFCLTSIGNIPVVFKVEVKNQPFEAKRGK